MLDLFSNDVSSQPTVAFDPEGMQNRPENKEVELFGSTFSILRDQNKKNRKSMDLTPYELFLSNFKEIPKDFDYVLNSHGHRSDEFLNMRAGVDILFSGCSFTFGEGLPYKANWSGILFEKIKVEEIPYYNLSYCGGGVDYISQNIIAHTNTFGSASIVFILFPESTRKSIFHNGESLCIVPFSEKDKKAIWGKKENAFWQAYKHIYQLVKFLESSGSRVIWSTWDDFDRKMFDKNKKINGYVEISEYKLLKHAHKKNENNAKYYDIARDGAHPGIWYNSSVAEIFYKEFLDV